jgi:hypothetical protein
MRVMASDKSVSGSPVAMAASAGLVIRNRR